jgi:hypothetical protein
MNKSILILSTLLAACGGGASGMSAAAAPDPFHGITVPQEPDAIANSTLLGVDSNNNMVRDDVERQIASAYGASADHYDAAMRSAIANQAYLSANGDPVRSTITTSNAVIAGACASIKYGADNINGLKAIRQIFASTFNTPERMTAYRATSAASTEVSTPIPANPCQ